MNENMSVMFTKELEEKLTTTFNSACEELKINERVIYYSGTFPEFQIYDGIDVEYVFCINTRFRENTNSIEYIFYPELKTDTENIVIFQEEIKDIHYILEKLNIALQGEINV